MLCGDDIAAEIFPSSDSGEQRVMAERITKSGFMKAVLPVLMAAHLLACGGGGGGGQGSLSADPFVGLSNADASAVAASAVTLAWDAPVMRADESPLMPGEIAGYRVYYGTEEGNYPNRIDVNDGTATQVNLTDLLPGTYYLVVTTYDVDGRESEYSPVLVKTI